MNQQALAPAVQSKTPAPHQAEALEAIDGALLEQDRATVVMACGTGKTLVELWAAQAQNKKRTIVFVPSLSLLHQVFHEWKDQNGWGSSLRTLCVCSDSSVGRSADDEGMSLQDLDFPTCTDPGVVNEFLDAVDGQNDVSGVIFCTYQSADIVGQAMSVRGEGDRSLGLAIFDEAHKTVGEARRAFSYALSDQNLQIEKRLFFTATPRIVNTRRARDENGDLLIASMDDESVYGEHVYTLSFAEAARRDIIVPYKVVISVIDDMAITNEQIAASVVRTGGAVLEASVLAKQIALQRTMQTYGLNKAITFHTTVDSAQQFADSFALDHGFDKVEALHVSGRQRSVEREAVMQRFRDTERGVISNARCLTEGVDVPAVDLVAFMNSRKSKVDIVQAAGRAMRKAGPEKDCGYFLIPLHMSIHDGEGPSDALQRSDFSMIADVLTALSENDESLRDIIRDAAVRDGEGKKPRKNPRIKIDIPEFGRDIISSEQLLAAIETRLIRETGCNFDRFIGKLQAFKALHGHCNVSALKIVDGQPNPYWQLGGWCKQQRRAARDNELTTERQEALVKVGFLLSVMNLDDVWQKMLAKLQVFKAQHGNCNVSTHKTVDGHPNPDWLLGVWCSTQRQKFKSNMLIPTRKKALAKIGFSFDFQDDVWQDLFAQLQAFKAQYGHCDVSTMKTVDGQPNPHWQLGVWCNNQRSAARNNTLTLERKEVLLKVGFSFDRLSDAWQEMLGQLQLFKTQYGYCNVSEEKTVEGQPNPYWQLGMWCGRQRQAARDNELTTERKEALVKIGFSFDLLNDTWNARLRQLQAFHAQHGHCNVPKMKILGGRPNPYWQLGLWCGTQRVTSKNPDYPPERRAELEALGFRFTPLKSLGHGQAYQSIEEPPQRERCRG